MSKENINLELTLATPDYFQPPSLQESAQESGDNLRLPSPAVQESPHGRELHLPSPAVQESPHGQSQLLSPAVQESVNYRRHRQLQFASPSLQEFHHRRHRQLQFPSPSVQEFHHHRQLQRLEQAAREYVLRGQLLSPDELHSLYRSLFESLPLALQRAIQSRSPAVQEPRSLLPPPPPPPPQQQHPWLKSPAKIHTLDYLLSKNINMISGEIICKGCKNIVRLEYNLREKFAEVCKYMKENVKQLGQKASKEWVWPQLGKCGKCRKGTLTPVISDKEEETNWLFLMLGQILGCCKVQQLKDFCEQNSQPTNHKKDCLVYIAYVVICKQLDPTLDFELSTFQN